MKIAVIDEGVKPEFKEKLNIIEDLMVNSENIVEEKEEDVQILSDHGLNVCKIINIHAPEAEIVSIRIFDSPEMKGNIDSLVAAFTYCLEKRIPLIHLSGGTINLADDFQLRELINRITNNGQIIVAAHSNSKGLSFPALYPGVFSARAAELYNSNEFHYRWGYSFLMPSKHTITIGENISYITQIANSYAAPALTGKIFNIINSNPDSKNNIILKSLGEGRNIFLCELPTFLEDVTIINLGSEIVNKEITPFKISNIYDDIVTVQDSRDYVFIPNMDIKINIERFQEFLNKLSNKDNIIRIFYLGKIDTTIESMMSSYPYVFWVLPSDELYPISSSYYDLTNCASIYFQGNKELVYYIMTKLRDNFLEDGFNCLALSDYLDATLYGIYYFEDLTNSYRRKQLEYVLEPDVELIYEKAGYYVECENSMLIRVLNDRDMIKLQISIEGGNKQEVYILGDDDIKKLFDRIVNME